MKPEALARIALVIMVVAALAAVFLLLRPGLGAEAIEMVASIAGDEGWKPASLTVAAGEPLQLRLTSNDVVHGFGVGQSDIPAVDILPGEFTLLTLIFDKPGRYTYYCTRWCGLDHWRMRGVIEVTGAGEKPAPANPPLYQQLGLDLDLPAEVYPSPVSRPSARRGAALGIQVPAGFTTLDYHRSHSPWQLHQELASLPLGSSLNPASLWDLTAYAWQQGMDPQTIVLGEKLYRENCAACHGEQGRGDGVMTGSLAESGASSVESHASPPSMADMPMESTHEGISGHKITTPTDFTRLDQILGRSSAVLQGKIIRGGMGTGMPYWGPIFTDAQTWALVDYLWNFSIESP